MRPTILRLAAAALMALAATPAFAAPTASRGAQSNAAAICRSTCEAQAASRPGLAGRDALAACSVRCGATTAYLAQQNSRGTAEATGRGQRVATLPMVAQPVSMSSAAPVQAGRQSLVVIYAGRAGSGAFGLAVGAGDRQGAHQAAERQCSGRGQGCRAVSEVAGACGAVAQGIVRSQWALMITSDPNTYVVTAIGGGAGASQQAAEQDAMADCRSRDPRATCRIVAATCGARS
jgi:hypothetical protein